MKTEKIYKFKIFGWRVWISSGSMQVRKKGSCRSLKRLDCVKRRLEIAGNRCEICGREIDIRCSLHHLLPVGAAGRNSVGNVMVMCSHCHHKVEKEPHLLAIRHLEDTTRYDDINQE